jgi:uncharacterized protein (DUF4415 family)
MTEAKFTQADLDAVSDNPELTELELMGAKPFAEVFPALAAKLEAVQRLRGRPKVDAPKVSTTLRLDPDVVTYFRSTGPGWQSRINEALRRAANL